MKNLNLNFSRVLQKPIPWESLTQSKEWNFKQLLAPRPKEQLKLLSIIENGKGNVQINFEPRKESPRKSYSANSFLVRTPSRKSNFQSNLEEVDFSSTIPNLKYTRHKQNSQNSPERSPTYYQMMSPDEPAQLMMMTTIYEIDKEYLRNEAKLEKHKDKAKWFFSKLTNEQRENFKKTMVSNYGNNGSKYSNVHLLRYLCLK